MLPACKSAHDVLDPRSSTICKETRCPQSHQVSNDEVVSATAEAICIFVDDFESAYRAASNTRQDKEKFKRLPHCTIPLHQL